METGYRKIFSAFNSRPSSAMQFRIRKSGIKLNVLKRFCKNLSGLCNDQCQARPERFSGVLFFVILIFFLQYFFNNEEKNTHVKTKITAWHYWPCILFGLIGVVAGI